MEVKPVDPKTSSIGDRLWIDTNGNGVQDGSEIGMGGVTVQLLDATGKLLATTTSAADGSYLFTGLAADVYQLQFGNKDGYGFTRKDIDSDLNDSDANVTTGRSQYVALGIAEHNRTVDAGYVPVDPKTSSIGDRVWIDTNGDGIQNDGATGVAGVSVTSTATVNEPLLLKTSSISAKLASLLQPADDLLHQAFGHYASDATAAHAVTTDGGDALRQMLAQWSQHHAA